VITDLDPGHSCGLSIGFDKNNWTSISSLCVIVQCPNTVKSRRTSFSS